MEKIVQDYRQYYNSIPRRIKKSSIKTATIMKKIGMPKATFYKKLKANSFDIKEVELITKLLAVEEYIDSQIKEGLKDIEEGRITPAKDVINELKNS